MKSIIKEIRSQPEHIKHIFMWLCVVITFSFVGFLWFKSTTEKFVALLHPEEAAQARILAEKEKALRQAQGGQLSPFAAAFGSLKDLQANISELLRGSKSDFLDIYNATLPKEEQLTPQKLPISE